jgi:hypothetical protein
VLADSEHYTAELIDHVHLETPFELLVPMPPLENGGRLEHAQQMAGNESPRTTKLYDRTKDEITLSEVERIRL